MAANLYDQAAQAQFINTYVPVDFNTLYQIGTAQKNAIEQAAQQFSTQLQKFGEFKSPSVVDTQNWYRLTSGRQDFQDAINQMASNPDALKDAAFRANLQSLVNSVDYAALSQLKESADNLRAGLEMRAKMEAEGRYNRNWDKSDIANYDTLGQRRVFEDITPVRWMSANELSDAYYNNLQPTALPNRTINGVTYNVQGITYDTLYSIADARFNDLVQTPQGQEYYREILQANGGNREAAREQFVGMIADSQRDRIREQLTVDPVWLTQFRESMSRRTSGSGTGEVETPAPTRQQRLEYDWTNNMRNNVGNFNDSKKANSFRRAFGHIDTIRQRAQQMATQAIANNDQAMMNEAQALYGQAENLVEQAYQENVMDVVKNQFKEASGFNLTNTPSESKNYSRDGYIKGVKRALNTVSSTASFRENDPIFQTLNAPLRQYTQEDGTNVSVYQFNTSEGFMLPETIFSAYTNTNPDEAKRSKGWSFRDTSFPLKELVESGRLRNVQFIPSDSNNLIQLRTDRIINGQVIPDSYKAIRGNIRIPVEQIEDALGTGTFPFMFGRESTEDAIQDNFGATQVKYGENGTPYYEFEVYRVLPADSNTDFWYPVNQLDENSPSTGGVGGASQAQDMQQTSVRTLFR